MLATYLPLHFQSPVIHRNESDVVMTSVFFISGAFDDLTSEADLSQQLSSVVFNSLSVEKYFLMPDSTLPLKGSNDF